MADHNEGIEQDGSFSHTFGRTFQEQFPTVESKIRHIVEHVWRPDADYMFYNWAQTNVALDGIMRPVIIFILPSSGSLFPQWHQTCDRPTTQIAFLAKTDFDFKTRTNDRLMQGMKILAARFIEEVNKSGLFERIPDKVQIPYQAVYDHLDENVTGIIITLDLKEVEGIKHCRV